MFLQVRDRRLDARRIDGPAPEVVFLHEGLGSVGLWRDFPDLVCQSTGTGGLVYSRAGYGASDPVPLPRPIGYLDDEAALVPEVLDAAGIHRAVLVGHSDGGSIALGAAAEDGEMPASRRRILGVAALAPHVIVEASNVHTIRETGERYRTTDLRDRLARHHTHVDVAFRGWHDAWTDPAFASWSLVRRLPAVSVPVLVVQGLADPYCSAAQARLIETGVSGAVEVLLLVGFAHTPQRERPQETLAAVVDLVRRSLATPAPS
jgi:pimeloyl-ACP methyl ester carboxylesterase